MHHTVLRWTAPALIACALLTMAALASRAGANEPTRAAAATTRPAGSAGRVFELRKYYTVPGRLDALNARFRNHTCALFEKHGMELIGFWEPTEGPEAGHVLVYILAFPSLEAKEAAWRGFRNDPEWKRARDASEKDGKIVEKVESTMLKATDYSAIR